jgi:hypothetical protein
MNFEKALSDSVNFGSNNNGDPAAGSRRLLADFSRFVE